MNPTKNAQTNDTVNDLREIAPVYKIITLKNTLREHGIDSHIYVDDVINPKIIHIYYVNRTTYHDGFFYARIRGIVPTNVDLEIRPASWFRSFFLRGVKVVKEWKTDADLERETKELKQRRLNADSDPFGPPY